MDVVISASLVTAFLAGLAALFVPCCIGILLPTYFASIFSHRRKVFIMTFAFFVGILTLFLPLGLGFGGLGRLLSQFHDVIFGSIAVFLIVLSLSIFLGFHGSFSLSFNSRLEHQTLFPVFVLGISSGLATMCCAPVLAGVLALSMLPGSVFWGGTYSFLYVLGMVTPLFIIALLMDKANLTEKFLFLNKGFSYRIGTRQVSLSRSSLISGAVFFVMGTLILALDLTGNLETRSSLQAKVNLRMAELTDSMSAVLQNVPAFIFALVALVIFAVLVRVAIKRLKSP